MLKKPLVFILCLVPLAWTLYRGVTGGLGPDPGKEMVLDTGTWALRFLILTLAVTPLRTYAGLTALIRYRRMLGLFCWFYASVHFVAVWTYLLGWSWSIFLEEFSDRPYMTVGILAWLLLLPLGITSNRWSQRRLGRRWRRLHQLIYPIAILACIHFIWLVRHDYTEPAIYSLVVAVLLIARLPWMRLRVSRLLAGS